MSLQFSKSEPALRRAKVLLIGDPGTGKTHAGLTFPKPAVIDAEGSSGWFADRFEFDAVATKSYRDVVELVRSVRASGKYETLVVDSLTSIYQSLMNAASAEREDLRPLDWGRIKRKFSQLTDELYNQLPMHVVCIGWVKAEYAKAGDIVNGKTVGSNDLVKLGEVFDGDKKAMHAFDFIFRMTVENGRFFATVVKSRSGQLKAGQRIENFSWSTIAPLVGNSDAPHGMTDDQALVRDRGVVEEKVAPPVVAAALDRTKLDALFAEMHPGVRIGPWLVAECAPDLATRKPRMLTADEIARAVMVLELEKSIRDRAPEPDDDFDEHEQVSDVHDGPAVALAPVSDEPPTLFAPLPLASLVLLRNEVAHLATAALPLGGCEMSPEGFARYLKTEHNVASSKDLTMEQAMKAKAAFKLILAELVEDAKT